MIAEPRYEIIRNVMLIDDYDEEGNVVGQREEVIEKKVFTGQFDFRIPTAEEEAEMLKEQAEMEEYERNRPLTTEERMEVLEDAFAEFVSEVLA